MKTWYEEKDRVWWQQEVNRELLPEAGKAKALFGDRGNEKNAGEPDTDEILNFMQGLKRLEGVSPDALVASSAMLPPESVRFFYVDENWVDALVEGALSAGGREYSGCTAQFRQESPQEVRTGFLLRSVLVRAFPAITVTPRAGERELAVERLAYLGEDVLLGIVSGEMDAIVFTEPEESLLCEFTYNEQGELCAGGKPIAYREGASSGVVDIGKLAKQMQKEQGEFTAAELGRLLLRDKLEYRMMLQGGKEDE